MLSKAEGGKSVPLMADEKESPKGLRKQSPFFNRKQRKEWELSSGPAKETLKDYCLIEGGVENTTPHHGTCWYPASNMKWKIIRSEECHTRIGAIVCTVLISKNASLLPALVLIVSQLRCDCPWVRCAGMWLTSRDAFKVSHSFRPLCKSGRWRSQKGSDSHAERHNEAA